MTAEKNTGAEQRPGTVILFVRAPVLGTVKTRLADEIGADAALALHRAFFADSLRTAREVGARVIVSHTTGPAFDESDDADDQMEQRGESFGERVDHAFADARKLVPHGPLLMLGGDTPHLAPSALARAFDALAHAPSVLGPTPSGGFYLIGFAERTTPLAPAFDGPGESARAARLLARAGLGPSILETFFDVDLPTDLVGMILHLELLSASASDWIPNRTAESVRRLGLNVVETSDGGTRSHRLAQGATPARD